MRARALAANKEYNKIAWRSYHEQLLNTEFALDRNNLSRVNVVSGAPQVITRTYFDQ